MPAPGPGERVILWVQNSHPTPIPAGAVALNPMGEEATVAIPEAIGPFGQIARFIRVLARPRLGACTGIGGGTLLLCELAGLVGERLHRAFVRRPLQHFGAPLELRDVPVTCPSCSLD